MSCKFCGKIFNRGFNLRRHEKKYCPFINQEVENMFQTEEESLSNFRDSTETLMTSENESGTEEQSNSTDSSETSFTTENEHENPMQDPWIPLIEEAKQRSSISFEEMKESLLSSGVDEQSAEDQAYSNILPKLQKELEQVYMQRLMWMKQLRKDPVHRKIMQTKEAFVDDDDFDQEEATEAAIHKRKFLIKRLLQNYSFSNESDNEAD